MSQRKIEKPLVYGSRDRFLAEALIDVKLDISPADRQILRPLAAKVAELAARPMEDLKRDLWYRHDDLEATRPLVFCDLENGWREVIPPHMLQCEGGLARQWELILRKEIYWGAELCDDAVIRPYFGVPHVHNEIDWGLAPELIGGESGGVTAYTWQAPIKNLRDLEQLRSPEIVVDHAATEQLLEVANETFGDLLPIRLHTRWVASLGMTATLAYSLQVFPRDLERVASLLELIDAGFLSQILISHDVCQKVETKKYGGHGYAHIPRYVVPMMQKMGVSSGEIRTLLVDNPTRMLAF